MKTSTETKQCRQLRAHGKATVSPTYDADGNMTRLETSTGTWTVEYNGENRPVTWSKSSGEKIYMMYDSQGRRVEKRVLNAAGTRTLRERYVYVGYTCVQVLNGDDGNAVVKEFAWDPTEPVATRPLMFKYVPNGVTLFYAFDGNKNVSDVFCWAVQNGVPAHYDYAPFGAITRTSKNTPFTLDLISLNPWQFSSEFYDSELDLVYYNYRHYSPSLGRFLSRDPIEEQGGLNLYETGINNAILNVDIRGKWAWNLICCCVFAGLSAWEIVDNYESLKSSCENETGASYYGCMVGEFLFQILDVSALEGLALCVGKNPSVDGIASCISGLGKDEVRSLAKNAAFSCCIGPWLSKNLPGMLAKFRRPLPVPSPRPGLPTPA